MCFKNNTRIMAEASELHDGLVEELRGFIPEGGFLHAVFVPVVAGAVLAAGGNVMGGGGERQVENGILFLATTIVKDGGAEGFCSC
ncbi:hypothetical protein B0T16DRAFT_511522 [Cercophora newfieldiana]|uniref:Uncharacterized protein n=1 Tax=Cercophora newfieldiana TaxID=92897 RepID=A0AA40CQI9_9PEZI|nr:hypothetical protein B0T16DRAFT_511522 [Cercophora newfieldiana]